MENNLRNSSSNLSKNNKPIVCFHYNTRQEKKALSEYHVEAYRMQNVLATNAGSLVNTYRMSEWRTDDIVLIQDSHLLSADDLNEFSNYLKKALRCEKPFGGMKIVFFCEFYCVVNFTCDLLNYFENELPEYELHFSNLDKEISCVYSQDVNESEIY